MALPEKLDKCPITPECTAKKLYRDKETGHLFVVSAHGELLDHKCTVRSSLPPKVVYLGVWYNKRTKRTRYVGPQRMRKSVEIAPNDYSGTKKNEHGSWMLQEVRVSNLEWKTAE